MYFLVTHDVQAQLILKTCLHFDSCTCGAGASCPLPKRSGTSGDQSLLQKPILCECDECCGMQGFGNVGAWAAEMIHVRGGRVICVSDRDGAMTNEKGLDIPALRRHLRAAPPFGGSLLSFPGGECCLAKSSMFCPSFVHCVANQ